MRARSRGAGIATAVAIGLGAIVLAGCGSDPASGDATAGKQKFAVCSSCHTLADFGPQMPEIGPNLDDAFRAARQSGMDEEQFAGLVQRWIKLAQPPMNRDLVTGQDAKDVAAYIAAVAGTTPESAVRRAGPETPEVPTADRQQLAPAEP